MAVGLGRWAVMAVGVLVMSMVEVEVVTSDSLIVKNKVLEGTYVGLVMTSPPQLDLIEDCQCFVPRPQNSSIYLAGRHFNVGKIKDVDVVYVMSGDKTVNAAMTVQILIDTFRIKGIVHIGTAGSALEACNFGDVCVIKSFAFTSSWSWKEIKSEKGKNPEMIFGDFNYPEKGENLLGKVEFTQHQQFYVGRQMREVFWLPVDLNWFNLATKLQGLKLLQCLNETICLNDAPKVCIGERGSTADVLLNNAAYREFLYKQFGVRTVDEESAAVVSTCLSNDVRCIVFLGVSSMAGGVGQLPLAAETLTYLAATNALRVAVEFIALQSRENYTLSEQ